MATNNFKAFGIAASANVTSQSDYEALAALLTGFQSGKASSAQINKALRQSSTMAYVLAQFISDSASVDVLDNGTPATILANLKSAVNTLTPGRQIGAPIVLTATGTYTPSSSLVKYVEVELYAAGGGAAGVPAYASSTGSVGGGGSAGTWVKFRIPASLVTSGITVTIGAAGAAGTSGGGSGSAGGLSSFGSLVSCPGGLGSGYSSSTSSINAGGADSPLAATIASSVTVIATSRGAPGNPGYLSSINSGSGGIGGPSPVGSSGYGSPAVAASGYGAGGVGARAISSDTAAKAGGAGAPGICIIRELA